MDSEVSEGNSEGRSGRLLLPPRHSSSVPRWRSRGSVMMASGNWMAPATAPAAATAAARGTGVLMSLGIEIKIERC